MFQVTCNVRKEVTLVDCSMRACEILIIATSCQAIIGFEDIRQTESQKQPLQALTHMYTTVPTLSLVLIYDADCLLIKCLRLNYQKSPEANEMIHTDGLSIQYKHRS